MSSSERVGDLARSAIRMWGSGSLHRFFFFLRVALRLWRAQRRRRRSMRSFGSPVPTVIALSPTMKCNYGCIGCYASGRPDEKELDTDELDTLLDEAEEIGIPAVVLTGGEPLLRKDLLGLIASHRKLLFVFITNGSLLTPEVTRTIAESTNTVILVSIEGSPEHTDGRRGEGAHGRSVDAFRALRDARACFGFATTVTRENADFIGSDEFIDSMIEEGCSVGYLVEYVPCGERARQEWVVKGEARLKFGGRVREMRRRKPIVLIHFPDDEYGPDGLCSAAGKESFHINSQGEVEPCPFVSISRDSVRRGGLRAACRSEFLKQIREHPDLLRRSKYACALFEHRAQLEALAEQFRPHRSRGEEIPEIRHEKR
jgi:MoaA/NifB/PqqE/SkfB family radical SAM enzyme